MNHLSIKNLSKTYANGVKALHEVSLEIGNGMFGLLGPNGAGKSSLLKTVVGLQPADQGQIIFNGVDLATQPDYLKQRLGFLPQDFGVYPKISAEDLLTHLGILKGLTNRRQLAQQVLALLDKTNLYAHRKKDVHTFSGGMRQRFGIAQALLGQPQVVIVDEPTAGLDPEERQRFNNLLSEIGEDVVVILSTHLVEDVRHLCPRMAIIQQGRVLAQGQPDDFVRALTGKLWQKSIAKSERAWHEQAFTVISAHLNTGRLSLHVLADACPGEGFRPVEPTLEDAYFAYLKNPVAAA
ncbi:MAG: ABC transporter ATP-binding protein [Bernardetiaceae bacterium]|nr:ABC transporter ATP-binding protein [Bernardetiaceae bacterium]